MSNRLRGSGHRKEILMNRVLISILATAAALSFATTASATATIVDQTGPDLAIRFYASQDPVAVAPNVGPVVYANAGPANAAGHNTEWSGFTSYNPITGVFGSSTVIDINTGGGFAQLHDHDFANNNLATQDLYAVVMDITTFDFTRYEFSIMLGNLVNADVPSSISVYYMLAGSSSWTAALGNPLLTGGNDNQFILTADAGTAFTKVLIASTGASIFQIKQNSVNAAPAVPEPATWALMLLGFGGIGIVVRRRRTSALMQIA